MKTFIYALTLVLFTLLKFNLQAQTTNCADISVQVIYPNPQSPGQFEYGARVILDRSYNEDIVVNGSISPNNGGFSFLFSVTVPAGQAMAQTQYLLQSTTALNPTISVLQISPTNVTSGGVTYNTQGFAGNCSILDDLNTVGQYHNDFQEYVFNYITSLNIDLLDTTSLKAVILSKAQEFFEGKRL